VVVHQHPHQLGHRDGGVRVIQLERDLAGWFWLGGRGRGRVVRGARQARAWVGPRGGGRVGAARGGGAPEMPAKPNRRLPKQGNRPTTQPTNQTTGPIGWNTHPPPTAPTLSGNASQLSGCDSL
jgi:hypothetical protein